MQVTRGKFFAC